MAQRVLVFDFGGPVLKTPYELITRTCDRLNIDPPAWYGPWDPDRDPLYASFIAGEMSERELWAARAAEFAELSGCAPDVKSMMNEFYRLPEEGLVRPESRTLIRDAKAAGIPVGMLTNDLAAFHPQEWRDAMSIISEFDVLVDGSIEQILKPDPQMYALLCERMQIQPHEAVYLDDQRPNVEGGEAAGMHSIYFDPTRPYEAIAQARALLGLPEVQ